MLPLHQPPIATLSLLRPLTTCEPPSPLYYQERPTTGRSNEGTVEGKPTLTDSLVSQRATNNEITPHPQALHNPVQAGTLLSQSCQPPGAQEAVQRTGSFCLSSPFDRWCSQRDRGVGARPGGCPSGVVCER